MTKEGSCGIVWVNEDMRMRSCLLAFSQTYNEWKEVYGKERKPKSVLVPLMAGMDQLESWEIWDRMLGR